MHRRPSRQLAVNAVRRRSPLPEFAYDLDDDSGLHRPCGIVTVKKWAKTSVGTRVYGVRCQPFLGTALTGTDARRWCPRWSWESIDVDRSRKVSFGRTGRKPAPMLVLRTLTVKLTANFCGPASGALRINSLESSLMIEWSRGSFEGYRDLSTRRHQLTT
jgi:hypothetical protein